MALKSLAALDRTYGDFYIPSFVVKVGRRDLVRELFLAVTGVDVDFKEKTMGHFSFTIANSFDWETREFVAHKSEERIDLLDLFAFGASVKISLGYDEPSRLKPMLEGIITEVSTSFGAGGSPELKISGYDALYPLGTGKNTEHWENSTDSAVVRKIVAKLKVSTDIVETSPKKQRIDQNEESDLAFVEKLAARNKSIFYVRGNTFYFGPRHNERTDAVELVWGEGLLSFSPQVNLAKQVTEVVVYGSSAETGKRLVGVARRGDEDGRDAKGESGADRLAKALSNPSIMKVRMALRDQAEAEARAKALLDERAQDYLTGDGECIGLPEIMPDVNLSLQGLGKRFSKIYYVSEAAHKLDSGGYRTTFKVQEPTV
jgi:phage protein D